jgi:hypothetical protein
MQNWLVFVTETECVYCAVRTGYLYTAKFKIQQFYVQPTQCIYVFCIDLRTNSDCFPMQNWLVFVTETECVYCAVCTGYLYTARFKIQQFYVQPTQCICVLYRSVNKQRLFPYTTLTVNEMVFTARYVLGIYIPPDLKFNNSTFCPYSVFMSFVQIWEQTAIISLYNIEWFL